MRTIDADELKKCAIPCEIHNGALTDLCVPLYQIDNAPTVEPDRPQGEWILNKDQDLFEIKICSVCDEEAEWLDGGSQFLSKFCPNCGAYMRGGVNNEKTDK